MMESIPVCGVAIRKDVVALCEAPSFLRDMAVGITPHEQSGRGIPIAVALNTERKSSLASRLEYSFLGTSTCSKPAMKNPRSR